MVYLSSSLNKQKVLSFSESLWDKDDTDSDDNDSDGERWIQNVDAIEQISICSNLMNWKERFF